MNLVWKPVTLTILVLVSAGAAEPAGRIALRCEGEMTGTARQNGVTTPMRLSHPQIFVIEPDGRRVYRALEPRRQLDDLCAPALNDTCEIRVTDAQVHVAATSSLSTVHMRQSVDIDRRSGVGAMHMDMANGADGMTMDIALTCRPGELPDYARQ